MTSTSSANATALSHGRRAFLARAGLASLAAAAGTAPALAVATHADASLLALRPLWLRTLNDYRAALDGKSAVDEKISARLDDYPDWRSFDGSFQELDAIYRQVADQRAVACDEFGGQEADDFEKATLAANVAIVDEIADTPAHSLEGLAFKVEVSADWAHERIELVESVMADILAIAGGAHA